ncbi:Putative glutathione-dependent formaldehyde-activating enzyme [Grimontia celer]|uniref:Putative glutathione-dependent formaldehyde-activating enzyme n=1 Tax=Grimontia celer TaxID=1796497 RepID=A0A128F7P3_9GAMM|nr:GFA family protein [Grimontia celer]CZF82321.1 Putative glutathione-dependent formaldehyde-activating enzyme [Grimontia celer]
MSKPSSYKGRCLCGQIQYEVDHIEPQMGHCHCSMCRKFHGAAFATFGEAKAENFRLTKGEDKLKVYVAENGTKRTFCENCGSSLLFEPSTSDGSLVEFTLGTLESDIPLKPDVHIFKKYKAQWYDITDELPQFDEGRLSNP